MGIILGARWELVPSAQVCVLPLPPAPAVGLTWQRPVSMTRPYSYSKLPHSTSSDRCHACLGWHKGTVPTVQSEGFVLIHLPKAMGSSDPVPRCVQS